MEKKMNEKELRELSLEQMDRVSGGAGNDAPETAKTENGEDTLQQYIPDKKNTRP